MRRFLLVAAVAVTLLFAIGAAIALGIHSTGTMTGATVTINGETLEGPMIVILLGSAVAVGAFVFALIVIALLASVAIVVPVVLVFVAVSVLVALAVGLAPIIIPVLLLVGAYVLLSRRARRRAASSFPPSAKAS